MGYDLSIQLSRRIEPVRPPSTNGAWHFRYFTHMHRPSPRSMQPAVAQSGLTTSLEARCAGCEHTYPCILEESPDLGVDIDDVLVKKWKVRRLIRLVDVLDLRADALLTTKRKKPVPRPHLVPFVLSRSSNPVEWRLWDQSLRMRRNPRGHRP